MILFIDGEWNGFGGELISIALVPNDESFLPLYIELEINEPFTLWVNDNVVPSLAGEPVPIAIAQNTLTKYLAKFGKIHIVADWPEDIERFCKLLITGPGERINTPPITMEIVRLDPVSDGPHFALADALALKKAYNE